MVVMRDCIVTVSFNKGDSILAGDVIKRQVDEQTFVGYLNSAFEQSTTGEFGFFKVYDKLALRKEFKLKDQSSIDTAFEYIGSLDLEPSLETDLQVFLLDVESVGAGRQLVKEG